MPKVPFFVALPRATLQQTVGRLANVTVDEEVGSVTYVHSPYGTTIWYQLSRSFGYAPQPSAAPSGKWRMWAVQALGPWRNAAKTFRWLGRRRQSNPDQVLGPWTHKQLAALVRNKADDDGKLFRDMLEPGGVASLPWVIYGDDPLALTKPDYEPTEPDITNDVAADEGTVFP